MIQASRIYGREYLQLMRDLTRQFWREEWRVLPNNRVGILRTGMTYDPFSGFLSGE